MRRTSNSNRGFTLIEMMISMAIGMVLVVAAAKLYTQALKATLVTSRKAELQQDFRAASNLLQRDISMAGAGALGQQGMATNAIGLPVSGTHPVYPCSGLTTCNYVNGAPVAYPTSSGVPYVYSIIPGSSLGITVNAAQGPTDIITVVAADATLALNCYTASIDPTGVNVTFQLPNPVPGTCVLPTGILTPQALNAAVIGLQAGDMILFGNHAVGVVTSAVSTCAPTGTNTACFLVSFAASDPGHINQPAAANGSLSQFVASTHPASSPIAVSAVRLITVTYYLDISPSDGVTPRLMRIQSGKTPAPVAENVVYLKFSYDINNGGVIVANQATLPVNTTPSMITKVNIVHMTMRSQAKDTTSRSALSQYGGYEGIDLQTSIAARNMTSQQEYPILGSSY
jgi:prepilin-type N-terminal cleavage/methylation domain-containing protein